MSAALRKASKLYRAFRERPAARARKIEFVAPQALTVMGHVDAIEYSTTHGRRAQPYRHDFAPGSKPLLAADPRTGKLFLIGGRYRVTGRGIVDRDARGRDILD